VAEAISLDRIKAVAAAVGIGWENEFCACRQLQRFPSLQELNAVMNTLGTRDPNTGALTGKVAACDGLDVAYANPGMTVVPWQGQGAQAAPGATGVPRNYDPKGNPTGAAAAATGTGLNATLGQAQAWLAKGNNAAYAVGGLFAMLLLSRRR
jgi:hypothetical protein